MAVPSPQYSVVLRVRIRHAPGRLAQVTAAIAEAGGQIGAIDLVDASGSHSIREITVETSGPDSWDGLAEAVDHVQDAEVLEVSDRLLRLHRGGVIEQHNRHRLASRDDLDVFYTPGVARVAQVLAERPDDAYRYTTKGTTVAVVTDGTAVLGLGDVGPVAALPVMEGKAMLFKELAGINAVPVCLRAQDADDVVRAIEALAPGFAAINLEDIAAPRCFEVESRLHERLDVPVFHDDQHGTAVVVLAGLLNAAKLTGRELSDLAVLVVGTGAAGTATARILSEAGVGRLVCADSDGALHADRPDLEDLDPATRWLAEHTNPEGREGDASALLEGMDALVGLSVPGAIDADALATMREDAIVFALANPDPEVDPLEAAEHARVVATGRSDFANQVNNVLCFPGFFRGLLQAQATTVTEAMKQAAAAAIAGIVGDDELREDHILPSVLDRRVVPAVADAVAEQARRDGQARAGDDEGRGERLALPDLADA